MEAAGHRPPDANDEGVTVLRTTRGTCPVCIDIVDARVIVADGKVQLEKRCPEHGVNRALLSNHPGYYTELLDFYHGLIPESLPQRDFIIRLTARCNMRCPICLASSDQYGEQDLPADELRSFLEHRGERTKLDLMGAEPTLRDDLADIIRSASDNGHITALHTNGIEIADPATLERLVDAGLDEVHLQFDGFDEAHDMVIRGQPMVELRTRALDGLERHRLATDLVVTVLRGLNENQMEAVLDYAVEHPFVKEVFYLGCRPLGRASEDFADQCIVPDELIDDLERATGGRVNRADVKRFQKLYFALLAAFRVRKCFYIHHYMVVRSRSGYRPVSELIDLEYLERRCERFRGLIKRSRWLATAYLGLHSVLAIVKRGGWPLLVDGGILSLMLLLGFDLSKIKRRIILIGFITACDPWIHDQQVAANCGKGEVSTDVGVNDAGADANVARERLHLQLDRAQDGPGADAGD
jgi:MoaA/NifB/PqqE/SkfB family radical SAM enzyme